MNEEPWILDETWIDIGFFEEELVHVQIKIDRKKLIPYVRYAARNKSKESKLLNRALKIKVIEDEH